MQKSWDVLEPEASAELRVGSDSSFPRAPRDLVVVCLSLLQGEGFRISRPTLIVSATEIPQGSHCRGRKCACRRPLPCLGQDQGRMFMQEVYPKSSLVCSTRSGCMETGSESILQNAGPTHTLVVLVRFTTGIMESRMPHD